LNNTDTDVPVRAQLTIRDRFDNLQQQQEVVLIGIVRFLRVFGLFWFNFCEGSMVSDNDDKHNVPLTFERTATHYEMSYSNQYFIDIQTCNNFVLFLFVFISGRTFRSIHARREVWRRVVVAVAR
jgi:hypothetical protein